jgi:hypothetical protein
VDLVQCNNNNNKNNIIPFSLSVQMLKKRHLQKEWVGFRLWLPGGGNLEIEEMLLVGAEEEEEEEEEG